MIRFSHCSFPVSLVRDWRSAVRYACQKETKLVFGYLSHIVVWQSGYGLANFLFIEFCERELLKINRNFFSC
jgi:hypothetical protein